MIIKASCELHKKKTERMNGISIRVIKYGKGINQIDILSDSRRTSKFLDYEKTWSLK